MKALWWKLSADWPCAARRWLWFHLAVPLLAQLERLTFKRIVFLAVATLFIVGMAQIGFAPSEMTFIWAGDTAFYLEVASAVMLLAARGHARLMVRVMGQKMRAAAGQIGAALRRYAGIARQSRNANAMRRKNGAPPPSGDEPPAWPTGWIGAAFA